MSLCDCRKVFIQALKIKLQSSHNLEEENKIDYQDVNNCISNNQQSDIGQEIDNHLSRFDINPPVPGTQIDLSHISNDVIKPTEQLFENYSKAFASHRYDTGAFSGFTATIEIEPGSSVIEKERNMRPGIREELQPIIDQLLAEEIVEKGR